MEAREIVEWAPFRIASGVSEEQLLTASRQLQDGFLARQPGFVSRQLLRGRDGEWVDLVRWSSREAAEQAVRAAGGSRACRAYFALMADADCAVPGQGVLHFEGAASYP